ncbi:M48 family metallopeptidase [Phenylobacterium sp.]|uniref:M48 family metallopeptidase n=1 Tax=Phenylobacterium sp. TaxID=1871053 RepID=UPI0027307001|nr:M48 family metallopeptidase [Phenylobacterium sp.]MDP1875142.1 M48 family metallopeptidase [Phenylobacterium sp.]
MQGEYFDGLTSRKHHVEVSVVAGEILGQGPGVSFRWPLKGIRLIEVRDGRVRLAPATGDGRLILQAADWEAASGLSVTRVQRAALRKEGWLVGVLAVVGISLTLGVFVGIPMAARPLARATPLELEASMGRNMSKQLQIAFKPCTGDAYGQDSLDALTSRLARDADMPFRIAVIPVHAPMINAFALPGGTILVTDDLIAGARSPDELAGVLAHEISHIEKRHVMEAVWRSLGVGLVLDTVVGGGSGAGQQAVLLASSFTEQRYSRTLEREADDRAFELLAANGISSAGMADFFERLADKTAPEQVNAAAEWFATHPDSGRRAKAARARAKAGMPALSASEWAAVRQMCPRSPNKPKPPWPLRRKGG